MMKLWSFFAQRLGSPSDLGVPNVALNNSRLDSIVNMVFMIAGVVAVITVIVSGIMYSLSLGDSAKTAKAKDGVIYSVAGLVIVSAAFAITKFIIGRI